MRVVYLVDDDPEVRQSWTALLSSHRYEVTAYGSAEAFLPCIVSARPGCILLSTHLPGKDGLSVQRELTRLNIKMPVIMVTARGSVALAVQAMRAGALHVLEKPVEPKTLIQAVREAQVQLARTINAIERWADARARLDTLSMREREVFRLVIAGCSSRDIASELGISSRTVENHRTHIMEKVDGRCLAELIRLAIEADILSGNSPNLAHRSRNCRFSE